MATKIPAAQERMFKNIFICKNCSARVRVDAKKVAEGSAKCRKCKGNKFRQIRKK
jgi:hypothetical protein